MPVTPAFWCALPFAPIWVAFQYHISVLTKDGYAFAMVPFTINSEESDKDQLKQTCHTLTTLCTDQSCALRSKSSQTSHLSTSTFDRIHALTRSINIKSFTHS